MLEPLTELPIEEPVEGAATSRPERAAAAPAAAASPAQRPIASTASSDELIDPEELLGASPEVLQGAQPTPDPQGASTLQAALHSFDAAQAELIDPDELLSAGLLTGAAPEPPAQSSAVSEPQFDASSLQELSLVPDEPTNEAPPTVSAAASSASAAPAVSVSLSGGATTDAAAIAPVAKAAAVPPTARPVSLSSAPAAASAAAASSTQRVQSLKPPPKTASASKPAKPASVSTITPVVSRASSTPAIPKSAPVAPKSTPVPAIGPVGVATPGLPLEPLPTLEPLVTAAALAAPAAAPPAPASQPAIAATARAVAPVSMAPPAAIPTAAALAPIPASASAASAAAAAAAAAASPAMDRDFIARNQIVERYLSGRLPLKGATDFERFCRDNPHVLDELGLPERVNAGLRLLEASGKPEPWQEAPQPFWAKLPIFLGAAAAAVVLGIALAIVTGQSANKTTKILKLEKRIVEQPLDAATATRVIRLLPNREGASHSPAITIGGGPAELVDLKIDESRSAYKIFTVTIDRIDQGRVGVIHNLVKDSNGHVRITINSSALGPGTYQFTMEGMSWRGDPEPDSWVTIGIQR